MRKKSLFIKAASVVASFSFVLALVAPARAFFLEVPKVFKQGARKLADEGMMMHNTAPSTGTYTAPSTGTYTAPSTGTYTPPADSSGTHTAPSTGTYTQPTGDQMMNQPYNTTNTTQPGMQTGTQQNMQQGTQPGTGQFGQQQGTQQTCRINGVDMPGPCKDIQGFSTDSQSRTQQQQGLKDMKQGVKQMEGNVQQFGKMMQEGEQHGQPMSQETQEKYMRTKDTMSRVKKAKSASEISDVNMEEFEGDVQSMEMERQQEQQQKRQLQEIKRGMRGAEQGLKMFEKQLAQLAKQKITPPAEITEAVQKIKTTIAAIKAAKTWEEVEAAGLEDLQEAFMGLEESRQQLEMLARWPQALKQIKRELANMDKELKRAKSVVAKLAKKGIDLADEYAAFEAAVNKLKAVVEEAKGKIQSGSAEDAQEAFELLENEFFGQQDDVWEANRIIQTMANLGQFVSDFKRGIADAKRDINALKRQRIDTSELAEILAEAKAKGDEIVAMLKEKPIDEEAVISALQEMEDFRQQFEEKKSELAGEEEQLPWEQGPQQFKKVEAGFDFGQFSKKEETATAEEQPIQ